MASSSKPNASASSAMTSRCYCKVFGPSDANSASSAHCMSRAMRCRFLDVHWQAAHAVDPTMTNIYGDKEHP
eukprot:6083250-Pyramimonas_sp.AAC.1